MASRSRSRKLRLSRMDAAIDAMMQYGFSEDLVRTHVRELLKAYGGYDGWIFIEDSAYKELLDSILRRTEENEQHQKAEETKFMENNSSQDRNGEEHGPPNAAGEALSSRVVNNVPEIGGNSVKDCSQAAKNLAGDLPPAEEDGKGWKDIQLDQVSGHNMGNSLAQGLPKKNPICLSPPPLINPAQAPENSYQAFTPRPCYAHIDNDERNTNEFKVFPSRDRQAQARSGKRKSRWDLRPEHP